MPRRREKESKWHQASDHHPNALEKVCEDKGGLSAEPGKPSSANARAEVSRVFGALGICEWFATLQQIYGRDFLVMIFCGQHLLKGFINAYFYTSMDFVLREYHVAGPKIQLLKAVSLLPWALKPMIGIVSDSFPVYGLKKSPYMVITTVLAVVAFVIISSTSPAVISLRAVVVCFMMISLQLSCCDLLTEAKYAERMRERPEYGPELMSYVYGGVSIGYLLAMATVGTVIDHCGPRGPLALCIFPSALIVIPTALGFMGEKRLTSAEIQSGRRRLCTEGEIVFLAVLMGICTLVLASAGFSSSDMEVVLLPFFSFFEKHSFGKKQFMFVCVHIA